MTKYNVFGAVYSEDAQYYSWDDEKEFKYYEKLASCEWTIEAESLNDAEKWLAKNHPAMYMGANIISEDKQSFMLLSVPCGEYPTGSYETLEARINYVKGLFA